MIITDTIVAPSYSPLTTEARQAPRKHLSWRTTVRFHPLLVQFVLLAASTTAFAALPQSADIPVAPVAGDAAAVIQHCGPPSSDSSTYDPTTRRMQRVLLYDHAGMLLRFQPAGASWSFTSGTLDGQVASLHTLESAFQCMRDGMGHGSVAASSSPNPQATFGPQDDGLLSLFGVRSFLTLALLSLATALLVVWPPPRRMMVVRGREVLTMPSVENSG
ncbi:hypothetical protein SAMN05421819_2061 [Bryocella elongata]|uniref:Uncharacterized protein n=1 Tax=Bryocella elongata TaxID=863522 RepID=A0A1H5Y124_9BACT|nr:hypothetical protein SAMN05421819_2061 [Bryocella elongata]